MCSSDLWSGPVSFSYGVTDGKATTPSAQRQDLAIRGNSIYTIVDGPSWTKAQQNAKELGGNLLTINDNEEYQYILDQYKDYRYEGIPGTPHDGYNLSRTSFFIGLNDQEVEGQWQWISRETSSWKPTWAPNQPDNYGNYEDWAQLFTANTDHHVRYWQAGELNDTSNNSSLGGLAEISFTQRGNSEIGRAHV